MALEISKTFTIDASKAAVWSFLTDPERVAHCLPGAAITEKVDDRTWAGTITVKVGPVTASYKGKARFERMDEAAGTAEIVASGQDVKGKGGADMRLKSRLVERAPGQTEVSASSQVNITGILAQLGRGMIQDVSDQMFQKFTEAMRAELESGAAGDSAGAKTDAAPAPIDAVSLGAGVARRAAGRAARRPALWIGAAVLLVLIYWIWFR